LGTIHTSILNLNVQGELRLDTVSLTTNFFRTHAIIKLGWPQVNFRIHYGTIPISLPILAYAGLWQYHKIRKILKENYTLRILITYDGLTYVMFSEKIVLQSNNVDRTIVTDSADEPILERQIPSAPITNIKADNEEVLTETIETPPPAINDKPFTVGAHKAIYPKV